MTIATCIVVPEGVVFGADSTISTTIGKGYHYLNHNQKIFEFGEGSTLGLLTWGLSSFREVSYRTLIALAADEFAQQPMRAVQEVAFLWANLTWKHYTEQFSKEISRLRDLEAAESRTSGEDDEYKQLIGELDVGFCIGGYLLPGRKPEAFAIHISPRQRSPSTPERVESERLWGQPDLFYRLYDGFDLEARSAILKSQFWTGTQDDLDRLIEPRALTMPQINIRDAIDFVHFTIYSTIKAIKFSTRDQVCGGPIELAVITTDRKFRWVRHKAFDSAVLDGLT